MDKEQQSFEDLVADNGYDIDCFENVAEYPEYRKALLGFTDEGQLVYDYDVMVQILMEDDEITADEAREYIDFNYMSVGVSDVQMPLVINRLYVD